MGDTLLLQAGGEPFPGYRLRQRIGHGGFSEVWEADDPRGKSVALKFMPVQGSMAASNEVRAIQGIRQLSHPNLLPIHQVWCQAGCIVIAMDLMEGSLTDLLELYFRERHTPMLPDQICLYLRQAAAALDFMNSKRHLYQGRRVGYQHCDVKPSNFLVTGDTLKLADFGLARMLTQPMMTVKCGGTVEYAAPEIHKGLLSERSDQYAFAVSYVLLRTGRLPFSNLPRQFDPNFVRPEPDLTILPVAERAIIARGLSTSPAQRWPSCTAMVNQISRLFLPYPSGMMGGAEAETHPN